MAYAVKYRAEFSDNEGEDWKVEILEDAFSGTVTTMKMTGNPLDFDWPSETDNCFDQNIRGSAVSINVFCEADFAYSELFTSDNLEYKVNIYYNDTTLFWTGWITANSWNEPYSLAPYPITISATDGLGLLKDMEFIDLSLSDRQTHSKIIHDILEQIGFDDFTEYINVYESTMDSTISDSPLDQAGADVDLWEEATMYETLKDILKMYDAAIIQYGGEMVIYRYKELDIDPQITQLMEPVLIRNIEGDNVSASSTTTLLEIGAISGTEITLTGLTAANLTDLAALINTSYDWYIQSLDDYNVGGVGYTGDYTVQDKVSSFNLASGIINVADATGFTVGDRICLYSPFVNYTILPGQEDNGILYSASPPAWRANSESSGPVWWDNVNSRYILVFAGYDGSNYETGFAYSTDMSTWTVGNSDAPIILNTDDAHFSSYATPVGNAIDNGDGTVSFAINGYDGTDWHIHLATCDKDDPTTITWGATKLISATNLFAGGIVLHEGVYHLLVSTMGTPVEDRYNMHYTSTTLGGTYSKLDDMWTTDYDTNDSHWLEGHSTSCMPFVENGKLYAIVGGTQRYTISGIRGNRVFGLMKYDGSAWTAVNDYEPTLIHPMYFYNITGEDYGWAGGHVGGYPSFVKRGSKCYMFFAMLVTTNTYQVAALEVNNTEHLMYGRTFTSPTAKTATTTDVAQFVNRTTTASNFIEHGGTLMIAPQIKELILTQDYGARDSILKTWGFNFEDFTGSGTSWDMSNWIESGTPDPRPIALATQTKGEDPGIYLHSVRSSTGVTGHHIYQSIDVLSSATDGFVVDFEWALINSSSTNKTLRIDIEISIDESGTTYYFDGTQWTTIPTTIPEIDNIIAVDAASWTGWTNYQRAIETSKGGSLSVKIFAVVESSSATSVYVAVKNMKVKYTNSDGQIVENVQYNVTNAVNGQVIEKEYILGDGDDLDNVLIMSKGAVNVYSGATAVATSRSWSTRGGGEADPIIELIGGEIGNQFSRPKHILDLEIYEQGNDFFTLIGHLQDDLNQYLGFNRKFIINRATYDVRMRKWNLSLNEII